MIGIPDVLPQAPRPFRELFLHGEIRAVASRIAAAVFRFFEMAIRMISEKCSQLREGVIGLFPERVAIPLNSRREFLHALLDIPNEERDLIVPLVKQVVTDGMNIRIIRRIIQLISAIPASEKNEVIRNALLFINPRTLPIERFLIIEAIAAIPADERALITSLAQHVMTGDDMFFYSQNRIIQAIIEISAPERFEVIISVLSLMIPAMNANEKIQIIQTAASIPSTERDDVIHRAGQLFTERMQIHNKIEIIRVIASVPTVIRPLLFTQEMDIDDKIELVQVIALMPAFKRADVIHHAGQVFMLDPRRNKIQIIEIIAALPAHRRANFVEREIRHAYAQGIEVHDRDAQTKAAIQLLHGHQRGLSADRIEHATTEFITYLDHSALDRNVKELARDALLKAKNQREFFGPLIDHEGFTIKGLRVSGSDLIGRLWIFASELTGAEQINAKTSMIFALRDSYDDGIVCNQGKTQRLLVAVLQGRLEGVNIDGEALQVTTAQATRMFFNVLAHQNIDTLNKLLIAANQFCNENPVVNREGFIREIHEYANQMGIK